LPRVESVLGEPLTREKAEFLTDEQKRQLTDATVMTAEFWMSTLSKAEVLQVLRRYNHDHGMSNWSKARIVERVVDSGFNRHGLVPNRLPANPPIDSIATSSVGLVLSNGTGIGRKRGRRSAVGAEEKKRTADGDGDAAANTVVRVEDDEEDDDDDRDLKRLRKEYQQQHQQSVQQQMQLFSSQRQEMSELKGMLMKLMENKINPPQSNVFNGSGNIGAAMAPAVGFVQINPKTGAPDDKHSATPHHPPAPAPTVPNAAPPAAGAGADSTDATMRGISRLLAAIGSMNATTEHATPSATSGLNTPSVAWRTWPIPGAEEVPRAAAATLVAATGTGPACDLSPFLPPQSAADTAALALSGTESFQIHRDQSTGGFGLQLNKKSRPITSLAQWSVAWHRVIRIVREVPIRGDVMAKLAEAHMYNVALVAMNHGEHVALSYDRLHRAANPTQIDGSWPQSLAVRNIQLVSEEVLNLKFAAAQQQQPAGSARRSNPNRSQPATRTMNGTTVQATIGTSKPATGVSKKYGKCRFFNTKKSCHLGEAECSKKYPHECWWCGLKHPGDECPDKPPRS
jgi:hypothetical protein